MDHNNYTGFEIAIIGMACKFPGASNVEQYWENLKNGTDSISVFSDEELLEHANREQDITNSNYVKSKGLIEDAEYFDAAFFGFSPNEANVLDPQVRALAQTAYHALEDASYDFENGNKNVGVFVGALPSLNWQFHNLNNAGEKYSEKFSSLLLNDKDFAGTRISYLLDLHGPSSTTYTACSTSLVTVDMACQSLLTGKSDMALAGGVALDLPYKTGYTYEQGMIMSKDGLTRSYDENASGTVWSDGVGMLVLKRLDDAIEDGDQIHAIVKGSSVNNDGNRKVGYTAPSVQGQVDVIADALNMAEVAPEEISYIEGHGSATSLGDKIEISALNEAFKTAKGDYKCPIGSVKSNIGHLNTASGVAGIIKVCLMLKHRKLTPTVHFKSPNATLTKPNCPFYVNTELQEWKVTRGPLRAGVSSFGIGGTNAHIILEEAPQSKPATKDVRNPLVTLSAKTPEVLTNLSESIKNYLEQNPSTDIHDLAYTLQVGRQQFPYRKTVLFKDVEQLAKALVKPAHTFAKTAPKIIMMFPGMGTVYTNLGKDLYAKEPAFRTAMDECFRILKSKTGQDYKAVLYPEYDLEMPKDFQTPQLLTFAFEYSLAMLLKSWGVVPNYVIGYSLGEYVAACVSGVFSLDAAVHILVERGRLINTLNHGGMLSVPLSVEAVQTYLTEGVEVAIDNGKSIVVAGSQSNLANFKESIKVGGISAIEINASYALHSSEMAPILPAFEDIIAQHELKEPAIPLISNISGTWCDHTVTTVQYWGRHLSETLAFNKGVATLIDEQPNAIFLEVGAGNNLSLLARRTGSEKSHSLKLVSLAKKAKVKTSDHDYLLKALGTLWQYGGKINWKKYHEGNFKHILSLPNYPFEQRAFEIVPRDSIGSAPKKAKSLTKQSNVSSWFYVPTWQQSPLLTKASATSGQTILVLGSKNEDIDAINLAKAANDTVLFANYGESFVAEEGKYTLNYNKKEDIIALFQALEESELDLIIDITNVGAERVHGISNLQRVVTLFQGISETAYVSRKLTYCVAAENVFSIYGNELVNPWDATLLAATKVIPQENPLVQCRFIEVDTTVYQRNKGLYYQQLLNEQKSIAKDKVVSYRGATRWIENVNSYPLEVAKAYDSQLQQGGTYIIIGGLGDVGFAISKYLLQNFEANLILIGRSAMPEPSAWNTWLRENDEHSAFGQKIKKAATLAGFKGSVEFMQADSTVYEDLAGVCEKVQEKYGQIAGLFHSAGAISQDSFNLVTKIDEEQLGFHFPVKTKGLEIIQQVVDNHPIEFVAIMSSLSSILGGLGMVGYAGANQFMDSMVAFQNNRNTATRWMTFNFSNWEGWDEDFNGLTLSDSTQESFIAIDEAERVFNGLFSRHNANAQVIISPVDLLALKDKWENMLDTVEEEKHGSDQEVNDKPEVSSAYQAASTDLEKDLVKIWEEIFGFGPIGIQDDFMELGGDSLKAITMLSHVQGKTGMTMSIQDFFSNTTIEKLCETIQKGSKQESFSGIPKAPEQEAYPLTSSQHRNWIVSHLEGGNIAYNLVKVIKLKGVFDYEKMQQAFSLLINRHETLRTYFKTNEEGEIRQFIKPAAEVDFIIDQLDFIGKDQSEIDRYLIEDQHTAFDFTLAPLFKARLLKTSEDEYIFSFVMHHIISDGWSMEVLISEIVSNYNTICKGGEVNTPALSIQYKDYALWKGNQTTSEAYQVSEAFWLEKFKGDIPVLELPSFKKRPKTWSFNGRTITHQFPKSFLSKLKTFAQEQDATMFMTLMAAINVLLSRYANQDDIVIGTPVAGREHVDTQDQIGLYLNTLAIRTTVSDDSFSELLQQQKQTLLEAFDHQNYPLDDLIAKLNIQRDTARSPLFDVLVVLQNQAQIKAIQSEIKLEGLEITAYEVEPKTAKFDLTFFFVESDTLELAIQYNKDIYDEFLVTRIFKHLENLIEAVMQFPKEKVTTLKYLSETEEQDLLKIATAETKSFASKTVVEFFEEQVAQHPNALALVGENTQFTYAQLNECVNQFVQHLTDVHQIKHGDFVSIKLKRSEWVIVSILAILKTGAAYVPLDVEYPEERINYIQNDSGYKLCIDANVIETFKASQENYSGDNQKVVAGLEDLACIIYTSGTTGYPKGVLVKHLNISNYISSVADIYRVASKDKFVLFSNTTFDASIEQLFLPLTQGGCLHVLSKESLLDTDHFMAFLDEKEITHLHATPSFLNTLPASSLTSLKRIVSAGEPCPVDLVKRWADKRSFYNKYGPTEATISATLHLIDQDNIPESKIPIGGPITNSKVYVLDEHLNLVPYGVKGELHIGGLGITNGYLNKDELTAQSFIQNPFSDESNTLFKTGDLVRMLPNGLIDFIERKDDQVKIRGYRIELGEIEKSLSKIDEVNQAVVVVKQSEQAKQLVAYYTAPIILDKTELNDRVQKMLPDYMVPAYYVQVDNIPLTHNGKVDKKALPDVQEDDLIKSVYIEAVSPEEKALASIWAEVLNNDAIGIKDNFYHLGGDSIKAILVTSRLKQQGYTLRVDQLLQNPILEDLAKLVGSHDKKVDQAEVVGEVAFTPIQKSFFEREDIPNKNHYNQSILLKSKEQLDGVALEKALVALTQHHDALRIGYNNANGRWSQFNKDSKDAAYRFSSYDLAGNADEKEEIQRLGQELQATIDISDGVLFHVGHFKLTDGDRLYLVIHHLVVDGVSWRILLEDLFSLYEGYKANQAVRLPLKTNSYQDWALAQQEYSASEKLLEERSYWESICTSEVSSLPTDKTSHERFQSIDTQYEFSLAEEATKTLQTVAHKKYNTEINDLLLTALGLAFKEVFGIEKSMIALEGHGREAINEDIDISRTVGWFTCKYPFLLDVSNTSSYEVIQVKEDLRAIPVKGIGYGILHHLAELFDTVAKPSVQFNYLGDFTSLFEEGKQGTFLYTAEKIGHDVGQQNQKSPLLLDIVGSIVAGKLSIAINYSSENYEHATIEKLGDAYQAHLESLIGLLSNDTNNTLTPSDLTYANIGIEELFEANAENNIEDIYELSPLQQGLYFHWLRDRTSANYFEQFSFGLEATNLDASLLQKVFNVLIDRHPILRTSFTNILGDVPLQIVHKTVEGSLSYEELTGSKADIQKKVRLLKDQERAKGFNLEEPRLIRLNVFAINQEEFVFVWSFHHIILDGWCTELLIQEFYQIWIALSTNSQASFPKATPYVNYINWLSTVDRKSSKAYWKDYLAGIEDVTEVPFKKSDYLDSAVSSGIHLEEIELSAASFQQIQQVIRELGITLNTYFQGVWGYLLGAYNNANSSVFGGVVSGRPADVEGVENIIGLFINTLPVKVEFDSEETPMAFLQRLHQETLASMPHQHLDLPEIQSLSSLKENLISCLFVFENYVSQFDNDTGEYAVQKGDVSISIKDFEVFEQTNYDFSILLFPKEDGMKISFQYKPSVYDAENIKQIAQHYERLLATFATQVEAPLRTIDFLADEEKAHIIDTYSHGKVAVKDSPETVIDLFERQVAEHTDKVAVTFQDVQLTYTELEQEINQFANYLLQECGVQSGAMIGIQLPRSEWVVIAMFGVLKSGAAYVPIDPEYPQDRIDYIVTDSDAKIIIDEQWIASYCTHKDSLSSTGAGVAIQHSDKLYMIYTSGSTGKPKGVIFNHGNGENLVTHCIQNTSLEFHKVLQYSTISFDVSFSEIFYTLCSGGSLYLLEEEARNDLNQLFDFIKKNEITTVFLPMSLLRTIFSNEDLIEELPKCIQHIQTAGEQVVINDNFKKYLIDQKVTLHNHYGPSETHVSTLHEIHYDVAIPKLPPIGKPIQNTYNYVVDRTGKLQPFGIPGELWIGGAAVGDGYQNRPDLTEEKFIENPFYPETKLYKSGDLVKWLPDGNIEFLGRIDRQVKIRGFRVEPSEVEQCLLNIAEVREAVVHVSVATDGNKQLAAYLVSDHELNIKEIKQFILEHLPDYMLPSVFMQIDSIPLTHNKKIDVKALPAIEQNTTREIQKPVDTEEEQLIKICAEVLDRDEANISMDDAFFDIGGHSIKAMLLISRIRKRLAVTLSLSDVFAAPDLRHLAAMIKDAGTSQGFAIKPVEKRPYYKASSVQRRLYYLQVLTPETVSYNMPVAYQMKGKVDKAKIEATCLQLIERHESLRTSFDVIDSKIVQIIHEQPRFNVEYQKDTNEDAERHIKAFLKPFDLTQAPLFRAKLIEHSADNFLLILDVHHIISDAFSVNTLMKDFMALYQGMDQEPLQLQYNAYSEWQYSDVFQEIKHQQRDYWKNKLSGNLTKVQLASIGNEAGGSKHIIEVPEDKTAQIKEFAKEQKVTLNIFLQAIFNVLLSKVSFQEEVILGTPMAGRRSAELEDIVGMFVNTVVLLNYPEKEKGFLAFLAEVKSTAIEAFEHQEYPFDELVTLLGAQEESGRNPIFNIMFEFQNVDIANLNFGDLELTPKYLEKNASKFDLTLEIQELDNRLEMQFKYAKQFFDSESIKEFSDNFLSLMEQVLTEKNPKLNDLTISTQSEEDDLFALLSKPMSEL